MAISCTTPSTLPTDRGLVRYEFARVRMGVPFRAVFYAATATKARSAASAIFARLTELDRRLSDWTATSELMRLCAHAGDGEFHEVSSDLLRVLQHAERLAQRTHGAFNVTVGPFVALWRRARKIGKLPSNQALSRAANAVGRKYVQLSPEHSSVLLIQRDMRLDLGGIAKGYAIDQCIELLERHGIHRALIDGGGDIRVSHAPPGKRHWVIAVQSGDSETHERLALVDRAVATSGDTMQFVEIDGVRYSHIIDPRTGLGQTDRRAATVVAKTCIEADGLATAGCVLPTEEAIRVIEACAADGVLHRRRDDVVEMHETTGYRRLLAAAPE